MIMVIERSYNLIKTERYYFFVLEVSVKKKNKVNLIDQGEFTFNSGNNIYVSKGNNYHIQKFESRGNFITQ